jgi:hypothetical protein
LCREAVEQATGRSIRAFLSQVAAEGVASEVFVLEPAPEEQRSLYSKPLDD